MRTVTEFLLGSEARKFGSAQLFAAMAVKKQTIFIVLRQLLFGQLASVTEILDHMQQYFAVVELLVPP